jgi:23S rRNA pseudouridine1911/1915/1917 synthase
VRLRVERGGRADKALGELLGGAGRRVLAEAFAAGRVRVNGRKARKGDAVAPGDEIEVEVEALDRRPVPVPGPLEVLYEDAWLLALAKPPGPPTHPLVAGDRGTLANVLVARYPECADASPDPREAGFAHRLDMGTSGAILAARDRDTWDKLRVAFHEGRVKKRYLALVVGEVTQPGVVSEAIAHDHSRGGVRVVVDGLGEGLPAVTRYEPVAPPRAGFTLLACVAETGRMHQVRAHLAHAGYPIVGDQRYGIVVAGAPEVIGHFLHAARLELAHPRTGEPLVVEAPLPPDRQAALDDIAAR